MILRYDTGRDWTHCPLLIGKPSQLEYHRHVISLILLNVGLMVLKHLLKFVWQYMEAVFGSWLYYQWISAVGIIEDWTYKWATALQARQIKPDSKTASTVSSLQRTLNKFVVIYQDGHCKYQMTSWIQRDFFHLMSKDNCLQSFHKFWIPTRSKNMMGRNFGASGRSMAFSQSDQGLIPASAWASSIYSCWTLWFFVSTASKKPSKLLLFCFLSS